VDPAPDPVWGAKHSAGATSFVWRQKIQFLISAHQRQSAAFLFRLAPPTKKPKLFVESGRALLYANIANLNI
jgi:hypothetical protein